MLNVTYALKNDRLSRNMEDADFLLSNKIGSYLYMGTAPKSKHQGFFINDNFLMYKALEEIRLEGKITGITNKFSSVIRERDDKSTEEFILPFGYNSFIYEIKKYNGNIHIDLDCRSFHDNDDWGRFYNIAIEKNQAIINYEKQGNYWVYVVITGKSLNAEKVREWRKVHYPLDENNGEEHERNVYTALRIKISSDTRLVISASTDKEKAMREGDYVFRNINKLKRKQENAMLYKGAIKNKDQRMAYNAALNSLNCLLADVNGKQGIISGFPFRPQFWSRDEMIAIKALGKRKEASDIFSRTLRCLQDDGRLPKRIPPTAEGNADSVGWFYLRYGKRDVLDNVLNSLSSKHLKDGLMVANKRETWMDEIDREGARLELQAMLLKMYAIMGNKKAELELKDKVKARFWNKKYLNDGIDDTTVRPNVLLAYYIYPELLTREEWLKCINNVLPKLWCIWGGVSTLDKKSERFYNAGGRNSFNGDSHFFINNITALALNGLDKRQFREKINKIADASTEDILWNGILGHHSEASNAKELKGTGCLVNAISAATYIEMINNL